MKPRVCLALPVAFCFAEVISLVLPSTPREVTPQVLSSLALWARAGHLHLFVSLLSALTLGTLPEKKEGCILISGYHCPSCRSSVCICNIVPIFFVAKLATPSCASIAPPYTCKSTSWHYDGLLCLSPGISTPQISLEHWWVLGNGQERSSLCSLEHFILEGHR